MEPISQLFQYREKEVELPNGYLDSDGVLHRAVNVRELSGEEEDILLDETESKNGTTITNILNRVCKLKDKPTQKFVSDLLMVDQLYLLVQTRSLTYGDTFKFDQLCSNQACQKISRVNLELSSLKFQGSSNPKSLEETIELPNTGVSVRFKKNQGKDQGSLQKIQKGAKDKVSQLLMYRIIELTKEGVEYPKMVVKSLPGEDRKFLREFMRKSEGDAETMIDFSCYHCRHEMKIQLPFDQNFFCLTEDVD